MKFDLGTILSITDGHLLTEVDNIYKILDFMTGESNFTHQLPRVSRECAPYILAQHPQLAKFDGSKINSITATRILNKAIKKYGNEFELKPIENYNPVDPFEELAQMIGDKPVIPVVIK